MQTPLISPNLHVVLIHYPLALLIVGTLIELFAFLWRRSSFRMAGRWMILIGTLSAIPATFSGIYALKDITRMPDDATWAQTRASSPILSQPEIWHMLRRHTLYQSCATGAATLVVLIYLSSSDRLRKSLHITLVMVLAATVGGMVYGAWFGGESIYKKGVAVEVVSPRLTEAATQPASSYAAWATQKTPIELMFPPLELHTIMAGVAVALAVLSIGLSFRKISAGGQVADDPIVTAGPIPIQGVPRTPISNVDMVRTFNPDLEVEVKPFAPAGRFWMLTFFIALLTLLGGFFVISRDADIIQQIRQTPKQTPQLIWQQIKPDPGPGPRNARHLAHAVAGGSIVVLPILLALLARFAPGEKIILMLTTFVLIAAVAFQIWLGILLLLDTSSGPLTQFNPPEAVSTR